MADRNPTPQIEGQLSIGERALLTETIIGAAKRPAVVLEVGTWLGGGSTLHILRALEKNAQGHLWGIEANHSIYERMLANLQAGAPEALQRFTPLFGLSQKVIPRWLAEQPPGFHIDFAFLDGGDRPLEQIVEFRLIEDFIPVGGQIMSHDARFRKGKWFVPYIQRLDNWRTKLHDLSEVGLLHAVKIAPQPSAGSLRSAQYHLFKSRLQPVELAAAIVPSPICAFVLTHLPKNLAAKLAWGGMPASRK